RRADLARGFFLFQLGPEIDPGHLAPQEEKPREPSPANAAVLVLRGIAGRSQLLDKFDAGPAASFSHLDLAAQGVGADRRPTTAFPASVPGWAASTLSAKPRTRVPAAW